MRSQDHLSVQPGKPLWQRSTETNLASAVLVCLLNGKHEKKKINKEASRVTIPLTHLFLLYLPLHKGLFLSHSSVPLYVCVTLYASVT